jgi:hypothetical protein
MYKKDQLSKNSMKQSTNLFALLDNDNDNDNDNQDNIVETIIQKSKGNIIIEDSGKIPTNNYKPKISYASVLSRAKITPPIQHKHITNNIEDEMFKQYYGRKVYKNFDNKKIINDDDDGFKHVGKKKEKQVVECTFKDMESNLLGLSMGNYYKVLVHHNDDQNWDYISYHNICTLVKWEDIPQLFNTMNKSHGETKFTDFDIFIMKNDISPMWEDIENRNGSICSIKVDSLKDGYDILKQLLIYAANNTLMEFSPESWDKINGLSFSPKRMDNFNSDSSFCVIIKIWFKQNYGNNTNIDKYFNPNIQELLRKYSVKLKSIKPEY